MQFRDFLSRTASPELVDAIQRSAKRAESSNQQTHLPHLILELLDDSSTIGRVPHFVRMASKSSMSEQIQAIPTDAALSGKYSFDLQKLADQAVALATDWGASRVVPSTFLMASLTPDLFSDPLSRETMERLRRCGVTIESLLPTSPAPAYADYSFQPLGFGTDITAMARADYWSGSPVIGMEKQLRLLAMSISSGVESVALVGEPGVGKSSLVYGLAHLISQRARPLILPEMDSWSIVSISRVEIMAGTGARGELEERLQGMLTFLSKNPGVVAFFDEIHSLLDQDDVNGRNIATAFKELMANGIVRCIGATTDQEYARHIARDAALSSRFTKIAIPEPTDSATVTILAGLGPTLLGPKGGIYNVSFSADAIRRCVQITTRFQRGDRQPRKSIRLLKRAGFEVLHALQAGEPNRTPIVTAEDVAHTFGDMTDIPLDQLRENADVVSDSLTSALNIKIRGQEAAIGAVTSWLRIHSYGWVNPRRPRGRFVFLGPPGVGKTELALRLAELVMQERSSIIVKNMGEYKGEGAKSKFMGSEPGYIGYGETSTVYSRVMMRPYSVVVLDEIEKAHRDLSDVLLSILDGAGEDGQGRWVDFSQCIFVMTSNAVTVDTGTLTEQNLRESLLGLGGIWTAPFLDRIDRVVLFQPLNRRVLGEILDQMIADRRHDASQPIPAELDEARTREEILSSATTLHGANSARGLDRALLRWLVERSESQRQLTSQ